MREYMFGFGAVVDLGGVRSAWSGATETADGIYLVRDGDRLQLWSPTPVDRLTVHRLDDRGIVVVDLVVDSERAASPTGPGVVLTRQPWAGLGSFEAIGIARPFEANLGVAIYDDSGNPVEAVYSGSLSIGTIRATTYAVQTEDWTQAWAPFAVRAEGLVPGEYTMVLNAQGGSDNPQTLQLSFTVAEPSVTETQLATSAELDTVRSLIDLAKAVPRRPRFRLPSKSHSASAWPKQEHSRENSLPTPTHGYPTCNSSTDMKARHAGAIQVCPDHLRPHPPLRRAAASMAGRFRRSPPGQHRTDRRRLLPPVVRCQPLSECNGRDRSRHPRSLRPVAVAWIHRLREASRPAGRVGAEIWGCSGFHVV